MSWLTSLIGYPLGWVMWFLFNIVQNYGVALFIFTVFTRLIMLPMTIKSQKNQVKMAMIKPQLDELQKKYANNRQKLNEEMMKLYEKEGYSPTSGCLPLLIQLPILFGLIDVIYKPLTHILRLDAKVIAIGERVASGLNLGGNVNSLQMGVVRAVSNPEYTDRFLLMGRDAIGAIQEFAPKLNFLGINLMEVPSMGMFTQIFSHFNPLIFVPILSGGTALIMSLVSLHTTKHTTEGQAGAGSMKGMMLVMPIFSTWITFSVPAGVGIYWAFSNIVAIAQSLIMHRVYNPVKMAEQAKAELEARKERERQERIEAKKKLKEGQQVEKTKALSQKEISRQKLAEARRRDAEKYGEEYQELEEDLD